MFSCPLRNRIKCHKCFCFVLSVVRYRKKLLSPPLGRIILKMEATNLSETFLYATVHCVTFHNVSLLLCVFRLETLSLFLPMFSPLSLSYFSCVHNEVFIGQRKLHRFHRMYPLSIETQAQFCFPTWLLSVYIGMARESWEWGKPEAVLCCLRWE